MKIPGAQALLQTLIQEGVNVVFGYPGGAIMPTYDALQPLTPDPLRHILVRHEQGAAHAAQGYAKASGKIGVCLATSGPGATNLVTGIADAMADSTPLVCITGQVNQASIGSDAFQEVNIIGMTLPITKWNYQITQAEEISAIVAKACYIAKTGRPGPVLLDITKDAQSALTEFIYQPYQPRPVIHPKPSSLPLLQTAATLINQAQRPYLLAGQGVLLANAEQELLALAELAEIPVACTLLGISAFPSHHPLYAGMLGMHGNYGANCLTNSADVIIAIGMRFDDRVTGNLSRYAKQAKIIHIDIDSSELNKTVSATIPLNLDAKFALQALGEMVKRQHHKLWVNQFKTYDAIEYEKIKAPELAPHSPGLTMAEVIQQLAIKTEGESMLITDVGQHQMITARYYPFQRTHSHLTSGGLGTMGFALPAAIGAKIAQPKREVIAIIGDGGFQMNLQELATIMQENLAIKILILNNHFLGMVRQWQELFYEERYSAVALKNPDFCQIAQAYGIQAQTVNKRSQLESALTHFLSHPNAYLLNIMVKKQENVFPMIPAGAGVDQIRLD